MMKKLKIHTHKGFTLVELLVVIAIIAILSVAAYVALGGQVGKSRDSRRMNDIGSIQLALEAYYLGNNNAFPETLDELVNEGLMPKLPVDPASDEVYHYKRSDSQRQYQLGATLEGEEGIYKAYVIGNSNVDLFDTGEVPPNGGGCNGFIQNGSTDCVPMKIWDL